MGEARNKQRAAFEPKLIEEWEAEDCVNFAVALARITGWLLHVDWWSTAPDGQNIPLDRLQPLRVYVADNHDLIFDVRGIKTINDFNQRTIFNLASRIGPGPEGYGGVATRFYDEASLPGLPLRFQPDEKKIALAEEAIKANSYFLAAIPARTPPYLSAHQAARFTYGLCAAFAEALQEKKGLQPVALLAIRFLPSFEGTQRSKSGYFHSVVLHPDGMAEDAWGKASLKSIADRFGVIEFKTSADEHRLVVETLLRTSGDQFKDAQKKARDLLDTQRSSVPQ